MLFKNLQWSPIGFEGELGSVVRPCPNHTIRSSQNPDSELVPQTQMTTMTILLHQTQMKTMAPTRYESFATVGEIRVYQRADFQSGSRVLKKVF